MQYVGETMNALKLRMTQHRSNIKHPELLQGADKPVAQHFNNGAHVIKDMRVTIARHNGQWTNVIRKNVERAFIEVFQTLQPLGMNLADK
jgi:hypothetical protein